CCSSSSVSSVASVAFISCLSLFFFNDTATSEIYTLSLHDALPIYSPDSRQRVGGWALMVGTISQWHRGFQRLSFQAQNVLSMARSEEHTSELQSLTNLVCRLLLEKKKKKMILYIIRMTTGFTQHNK